MIVDAEHNLGFTVGTLRAESGTCSKVIAMYDLETLELLDTKEGSGVPSDPESILSWGVDTVDTRLIGFTPFDAKSACQSGGMPSGLDTDFYFDYERVNGQWRFLTRTIGTLVVPIFDLMLPCPGHVPFFSQAASVHVDPSTGRRLLYVIGSYAADRYARDLPRLAFGTDVRNNAGSPFYVRQIDLDVLSVDPHSALDWQIDLHKAGCGRFITFFVERTEDSVITYCHDANGENSTEAVGQQGYVVRILLDENDDPLTANGGDPFFVAPDAPDGTPESVWALPAERLNAVVRRIPTLPGFVRPFVDPRTGRVMLLTDDNVNGEAVWVLDAVAERFIGVMAPGDDPPRRRQVRPGGTQPSPGGAGFDRARGRAYVYGVDGIVVASGRQDPPMAGTFHGILGKQTHPLQSNEADRSSRPLIAVAPQLNRLLVPVRDEGYIVLEDDTPAPQPPIEDDLDRFTTQVDEVPGVTEANTQSEAEATGLHVVIAGGTSNVINPNEPACSPPLLGEWESEDNAFGALNIFLEENNERSMFGGSCLTERALSRGHRDFSLGYSSTRGGTSTGVEADGQAVAFSPNDSATDHDLRNAGECYRSSLYSSATDFTDHWSDGNEDAREPFNRAFASPDVDNERSPYGQLCHEPQDRIRDDDGGRTPDLNAGTYGRDGTGFPAPGARCTHADDPDDHHETAAVDTGQITIFSASARCDGSHILGQSESTAAGFNYREDAEPPITVGSFTSDTVTRRTSSDGVVTQARARADDVRIGPLHVGTAWSLASAKAHGRTGTAQGELKRAWCDVSVDGTLLIDGCKDAESDDIGDIVDAFNQAAQKVRLSVPVATAEGTPGGYQGVVIKDPAVSAADRTVNEDDSLTVPALQAVLYNDNTEGRSRTVFQFAGVRGESSYGIVLLPQFSTPDFGFAGFTAGGSTSFASLPINRPVYGVEARPPRFAEQLIVGERSAPPENLFTPATRNPVLATLQALEWLRQHPREAALLFLVFSILGLPVYLVARRRAFERSLLE